MCASTFLLISGAWHSSASWQRVVPLLVERGHRIFTPELLGMGSDLTPPSEIKLSTWVTQIVDLIKKEEQEVILVGHSRGGLIISAVAECIPEGIKLLVYVTAFLIPSGGTILEIMSKRGKQGLAIRNPNGTSSLVTDKIVPMLYNTTPLEWAERVFSFICPEPSTIMVTPLHLTDDHFGRVPRAYIECKQDNLIPLEVQRSMQSQLPCKYTITLDTDHSPFFSAPIELAHNLITLASK